jgi:hypothetical protein
MKPRKVEVLLDGIACVYGAFHDPESLAYRLRNPLLIKSFSTPGKHLTNDEGLRQFDSFLSGYTACVYDLVKKVSGASRARIATTDPLSALLSLYGITESGGQRKIVNFLRRALADETITDKTPLSYFNTIEPN